MKNNKKKIIIICLFGLLMCIGIGFAAFSTTLKINGSAKVSPNGENYKVVFASEVKNDGSYLKEEIEAVTNPDGLESKAGEFTSDTTFENESVTFTEDNQKAMFTFYLYNAGKYDAHINGIEIGNKTCELIEGSTATEALVNEACEDIKMTVSLGEGENKLVFDQSQSIEDYVLNKGDKRLVVVTMEYLEGGFLADGEFNVKFGEVELFIGSIKMEKDEYLEEYFTEEELKNMGFYISRNSGDKISCAGRYLIRKTSDPIIVFAGLDTDYSNRWQGDYGKGVEYIGYLLISNNPLHESDFDYSSYGGLIAMLFDGHDDIKLGQVFRMAYEVPSSNKVSVNDVVLSAIDMEELKEKLYDDSSMHLEYDDSGVLACGSGCDYINDKSMDASFIKKIINSVKYLD